MTSVDETANPPTRPLSTGQCDCVSKFNAKLAEHNAAIVTTMFGSPVRPVIETYKLDSKKRGKPPLALASFCPFCGTSLDRATSQ